MNFLNNNTKIYKRFKMLRPAIGAIFFGNIRPMVGYLRYLTLEENKLKNVDFETLSIALYHSPFIPKKVLYSLSLNELMIVEFNDKSKFALKDLLDYLHAGLYYERKTFDFIMKYLRNSKVFVDVGANIGGYAIRAAKYCKVYAIEPLPRNYKMLKINEKLNNVKVNSFNMAAGNKNSKIKLYYTPKKYGRPSIKRKQTEFIEVEMKPLDEIINEEKIDLIKIDVEGAEDLVLEGAKNCLKRTNVVIIEKSESFPEAYRILKEEGFKFRKFLDDNILFTK